ncbi:MAG: metallophosphoesterase family protein [Pseudomonadota bacterium]
MTIRILVLSVLFSNICFSGTSYAKEWFFRGTSNQWQTAPMQVLSENLYEIEVSFNGEEPTARFKIDRFGDWSESYPNQDYVVNDFSRYLIQFNTLTQQITVNVLESQFSPYIGPYVTLLIPKSLSNSTTMDDTSVQMLDPSTHIVINFELKPNPSNYLGRLRYRQESSSTWLFASATEVPWQTERNPVQHIILSNLAPQTSYEYQLIDQSGNLSPSYFFKTATTSRDQSRFLVIGDMQDEQAQQRWQDIANAITESHLNDFDFIITVGDMVKDDETANNDRDYWWKVFFDKGKKLFSQKPLFPALGNHETPENPATNTPIYSSNPEDTLSFRKYFFFPFDMTQPDYYSFVFGNTKFLSINSEIPVYYGNFPERDYLNRVTQQNIWIDKTLKDISHGETWRIAYHHVPIINPAGGKSEVEYLRPLAREFNGRLDWSITGHVHTFQRLRPLVADESCVSCYLDFKSAYGFQNSVGYLITPPAGQWPRRSEAQGLFDNLAAFSMYQGSNTYETGFTLVQTQGNQISMQIYGLGDTNFRNPSGYGDNRQKRLLDAFSYTKSTTEFSQASIVYYRGTTNGWNKTAMTQVAPNLWQITVLVTPGENNPRFKFYQELGQWLGDTDNDGVSSVTELNDILFNKGPGSYTLQFDSQNFSYQLQAN